MVRVSVSVRVRVRVRVRIRNHFMSAYWVPEFGKFNLCHIFLS